MNIFFFKTTLDYLFLIVPLADVEVIQGVEWTTPLKKSSHRPPNTPWTTDGVCQALQWPIFFAFVYVQNSITNFKKCLIFIYRNSSMQRDWVSRERKPRTPVGKGKKKQQFKCWKVEWEWTFLEFLVGAKQLCWALEWRHDICASVGQSASQVKSTARPARW